MLSEGFLYRRLAGIVPCALRDVAGGALVLRNKWQVASARDVFLSSHYWRLFDQLDAPPSLIVDLGGHCGHFVVLCELVLEERFGAGSARYLIVEGLPELVDNVRSTLADTGLESRCTVRHGLVGRREGSAVLRSGSANLLETSAVMRHDGEARGVSVPYIDLLRELPEGATIDILKVDIEGSEYDLCASYPTLLERTRLVAMEVHDVGRPMDDVLGALKAAGLEPCAPHIKKGPNLLVLFKRRAPV
jgi:FkbM family methyltransferase